MKINESFEKTITDNEIERWRYPRFFTDNIGETAVVTGGDAAHITQVLRMKPGDFAIICDGKCTDRLCRIISAGKSAVELEILDERMCEAEPTVYLRLFQCMPKSDKMDFIVQKAVELGAAEIVPVLSKRCVSRPDDKSASKKQERWQKIADEASKQCGRGRIPVVSAMCSFSDALKISDGDKKMLFYECGGKSIGEIVGGMNSGSIDIFIGSEGGFEKAEVEAAEESGFVSATLGKRILRCETAPIAAISVLMNVTGNM